MEETDRILQENIIEAQERQTKYAGGNEMKFYSWGQSMAIDQKLENIQAFKEARLQAHMTVYGK